MFLAGMFWRWANANGAIAAIVTGLIAGTILFVLNEITDTLAIHFLYIASLLLVVCSVAMIIASLRSEPPSEPTVSSMTWSPAFFRDETVQLRELGWYQNYRILSAILGSIFLILMWIFR